MHCKKEEYIPGSIFHFYNRTGKGKLLFYEDDDYIYLLKKFKKNMIKYPCEVFAYCLMPNHFHFCLKQNSEKPIYRLFNDTLVSYSHHYNSKYGFHGHLFSGKLQSKRIIKTNYLIQICRYIHYNPVKAGLVKKAGEWQFSNFLEITGKRRGVLFSFELIKKFPEEFENYAERLREYEEMIKDRDFLNLMIDE